MDRLIEEAKTFLKKYQDALADDPNSFGAKLMVGNLKHHLEDLERQAFALNRSKKQDSTAEIGRMVASGRS